MKKDKSLTILNMSVFLQTQFFLLPVLFLFYQHCGLSIGDFFLFQGIFSLFSLIFEIPLGYLGDIISKKSVLILSYSFFIVRVILWLFFSRYGYWVILSGEILYAAQKASFSGAADSYIYEYLKYYNIPQKMSKCYGKMNFFMSAGTAFSSLPAAFLYHKVAEWTLQKYNYDYGFVFLLAIELILNSVALYLLTLLPKVPQIKHRKTTAGEFYKKFFRIIVWTIKKKNIRYHSLYSGLILAMTSVFVWSFQPIMKLLLLPVHLYGVVYFINHLFRALASLNLGRIRSFIPLSKMYVLSFILFVLSFVLTFVVLSIKSCPVFAILLYFTFISLTIAMQLVYHLSNTSRLHTLVLSGIRTTVSSVNMAIGRLFSAFFLVLIKFLLRDNSIYNVFIICFVIFVIAAFILNKVYSISRQEEKQVE